MSKRLIRLDDSSVLPSGLSEMKREKGCLFTFLLTPDTGFQFLGFLHEAAWLLNVFIEVDDWYGALFKKNQVKRKKGRIKPLLDFEN